MVSSGASLVSVIVPAWNSATTLDETLRSVSAQTYPNIEIIIVDDGSTDATADIAAAFCAREPRARLIRKDNGGVGSARNRGIEVASGEWVAPIDADDLWHPTKIEKQAAAALSAPRQSGFVYCWYHYIDEASRVIGSRTSWLTDGPALRQLAYENLVGNGSGALFWRSAIVGAGGFDADLREGCEDLLLQLLISDKWPITNVPEYLVGYRIHPDTMSRKPHLMQRAWERMFAKLHERGVELPQSVIRRALAAQMLGFAETRARNGSPVQGLRLLAGAIRLDPVRCGLHIVYRIARLAARLARGRQSRADAVPFSNGDTSRGVELDPDALPGFSRLLRRFDERRLSRLRASEPPLAPLI